MIEFEFVGGGQTGADIAGWIVAKEFGLPTSGWMPKGFKTEEGFRPEYEALYGARETRSASYWPRTEMNAKYSNGTIIIAHDFKSPGTYATKKYCDQNQKPCHLIPYLAKLWPVDNAVFFIEQNKIRKINIAGNRESVCPGIQEYSVKILKEIINRLKERGYIRI